MAAKIIGLPIFTLPKITEKATKLSAETYPDKGCYYAGYCKVLSTGNEYVLRKQTKTQIIFTLVSGSTTGVILVAAFPNLILNVTYIKCSVTIPTARGALGLLDGTSAGSTKMSFQWTTQSVAAAIYSEYFNANGCPCEFKEYLYYDCGAMTFTTCSLVIHGFYEEL